MYLNKIVNVSGMNFVRRMHEACPRRDGSSGKSSGGGMRVRNPLSAPTAIAHEMKGASVPPSSGSLTSGSFDLGFPLRAPLGGLQLNTFQSRAYHEILGARPLCSSEFPTLRQESAYHHEMLGFLSSCPPLTRTSVVHSRSYHEMLGMRRTTPEEATEEVYTEEHEMCGKQYKEDPNSLFSRAKKWFTQDSSADEVAFH